MTPSRPLLCLIALAILIRVAFLFHPVQGDDVFYLAIAQHAQVEPAHPLHFKLIASGIEVDMRGYAHPPGNAWILAALLAGFGDIREAPFHAFYALFSVITVIAAWSIAKRFSPRPFEATLLFIATPAWVINGNSFESDLPFLAIWLSALALWIFAVDRRCIFAALAAAMCAGLAGLTSFQSVMLIVLFALYLWSERRHWRAAWALIFMPAIAIAAWQGFEKLTGGSLPADVLNAYSAKYEFHSLANKAKNALAMTVHLGWMAPPVLAWVAFSGPALWAAAAAALAGAFHDPSPLFWLPFGTGAGLLVWIATKLRERFLPAWILLFFAATLVIFFAGSARYLLPVAVPLSILLANRLEARPRLMHAMALTHLALGVALALANFQHWDSARAAAASAPPAPRLWTHSEHGLRFYAEAAGARQVRPSGQTFRPGDVLIASALAGAFQPTGGGEWVKLREVDVRPALPFRLLSSSGRSGYSSAKLGQRAFDIDTAAADRVSIWTLRERAATLTYLTMNAPGADTHFVSGVYALDGPDWRWTAPRAVFTLKAPESPQPVEATFRIIEQTKGRKVSLAVGGETVAEETYPRDGLYTLRSERAVSGATVTLTVDRAFQPPNDQRELGVILTGVGFRPLGQH
ncbi:MAG: glycosyltransferase family 39 protein [Bryobacteraceae bacterium]